MDAAQEYDRQVGRFVELGYPAESGRTVEDFTRLLAPLRDIAVKVVESMPETEARPSRSKVPFVVVVTSAVLPSARAMPLTRLRGKPGFVSADTTDIDRFTPIAEVALPDPEAYLLVDVDRGDDLRDVRPNDALVSITGRGRSPLTVDEGVALIATRPEMLEKNHCFSLLGSRCGDKRVPALWISGGAPKLGWCWAGNPHTWLGSASCGSRVGT